MEQISKKNRKQILGKEFFLADEKSLSAKLNYKSGVPFFDDILQGKSQKEYSAALHLYIRKAGVEIKLSKLFKYFSIGIAFNEIQKILFIDVANPKIEIILQNETITLTFDKRDFREIIDFFYKHLYSNVIINIKELHLFKTHYPFLMEYKKKFYCARINRLDYFLWILSIGVIGNFIVFVTENLWGLIITLIIWTFLTLYGGALRFQDLNKKPINTFKLLIPIYNIYIQLMLFFTKGDSQRNQYGVNPSYSEDFF
jgi:hypothetical protein